MSIKHGSTRTVFLIGRWAIKIPSLVEWRLFLMGLLANLQEQTFSKTGWPGFCPVLWALPGGFVLVMRRARPLTREEFDSLDCDAWRKRGDYYIPGENKLGSFGYLDGHIVAIDYGN